MNTFEFISSIINSIIWPVTIFVIFLLLRRPISKMILGLTKLKYNDLELDFEQELNSIEMTIGNNSKYIDNEVIKIVENEVLEVAKINPRVAVTMAWNLVEKEILETIQRLAVSADFPPYNSSYKNLIILKENNYIDNTMYETLNEFRMLRNIAAHSAENETVISYMEAEKYYRIALKMIEYLKNVKR